MIDHTGIGVSDVAHSARFYDAILGALGLRRVVQMPPDVGSDGIGYGTGQPIFWIDRFHPHGVKQHTAFAAATREQVIAFHAAGLRAGGKDNGAPGYRSTDAGYPAGYYAAFILDPDGNNVEAVFREASGSQQICGHVHGDFDVQLTPEHQGAAPEGGAPTSRLGLVKTFHGALQGVAHGTMISAGDLKPGAAAAYVAIDQFVGQLEGRRGGFVLTHRGTIAKSGAMDLVIAVTPDSGSGELAGITGSLSIDRRDGKHFYDFTYTLPAP